MPFIHVRVVLNLADIKLRMTSKNCINQSMKLQHLIKSDDKLKNNYNIILLKLIDTNVMHKRA